MKFDLAICALYEKNKQLKINYPKPATFTIKYI